METCVKKDCPFIPYCKDYKLVTDKTDCPTQDKIMRAAKQLERRKHEQTAR